MEVPRGFTRCDECEGEGRVYEHSTAVWGMCPGSGCPSCSGSGLVPTEKLREDVASRLRTLDLAAYPKERYYAQADMALAKVAEYLARGADE